MTTITGIRDGALAGDALSGAALRARAHGAIASFLGVVRDEHHGRGVTHLVYDCYRPMCESLLPAMAADARAAAGEDLGLVIVHGIGRMDPGEVSLAIHVASAHRGAAFDACRALLERIKRELPVWKHEFYTDGSSAWLEGS